MTLRRRALVASMAGAAAWVAGCGDARVADAPPRWPVLQVRELGGEALTLASTSRGPRVINFWALWCPPCRYELPSLERLARDFAPRGIEVSAIALADDGFPVREYLQQHAAGLRSVLLGPRTPDAKQLGLTMLPQTFFIAADGLLLGRWTGAREWDAAHVRDELTRLLQAG